MSVAEKKQGAEAGSIQVVRTRSGLEAVIKAWKDRGMTVGYVPTMGALHDGHVSLVRRALDEADRVVVSIFVNPTQFAPDEDLDTYPREEEQDVVKLDQAGAHLVYLPAVEVMYPEGAQSDIKAGQAAKGLETDFRPHFFDGVVNVVSRLFAHVRPDLAVFGEKDFQQLCVIREMVEALDLPIRIVGAPIVRDAQGLALSSRNAYLSEDEASVARTLNTTLFATAEELSRSPQDSEALVAAAERELLANGFDAVDYVSLWNGRLLAAVWIGKTRLIDNVAVM